MPLILLRDPVKHNEKMGGAHPIFIHSWINILRDVLRAVPRCGVRADTFNGNIWLSCLSASHTVYARQEV